MEDSESENEDVQREKDIQPEPERPVRQTRTNTGAVSRKNYQDLAAGKNSNFLIEVMAVLQNNDNGDLAELALPANDDPMTWDQAKASPYWPQFQEAMKEEMKSLEGNSTWEVIDKPTHQHTLTGRWVFKLKCDANGKIVRYKARWVVHGYKTGLRR